MLMKVDDMRMMRDDDVNDSDDEDLKSKKENTKNK